MAPALAAMLTLSACSSESSVTKSLDVIELAGRGDGCVTRDTAGGSACFTHKGRAIDVSLVGLAPHSAVTVEGAAGATVQLSVAADGTLVAQLDGQIVEGMFSAAGTWADGEPLDITVRPAR